MTGSGSLDHHPGLSKELTLLTPRKYYQSVKEFSAQLETYMGSFGENLRREREMRNVTLEEMSDATKIRLSALEALEAEDFSKLPGGIFNRSFVRTYARFLGLDEEKILAEYQAVCPKREDVDLKQFNPVKPSAPTDKGTPRARLLVLTLVLALSAAGYVMSVMSRRRATAIVRLVPAPAAAAQPEAKTPTETPVVTASQGPVAAPDKTATTPAAPAGDSTGQGSGLVLQIAATERSWVAVEADGKPAFQRLLNPHDIQTVKATTSFDFVTGNAQGVILTLNGETLKPLGEHGEFKKLHLTKDDLKSAAP